MQLFLGSAQAANATTALLKRGITHVLTMASDVHVVVRHPKLRHLTYAIMVSFVPFFEF